MEFSMPLPNSKNTRGPIMLNIKTSDPYDLKPVELTPAELDSVAGGGTSSVKAAGQAAAQSAASAAIALASIRNQINNAAINATAKSAGSIKGAAG
jgi:predicted DNA-binding transcriptional regulator YafY